MPNEVISRAKVILNELEDEDSKPVIINKFNDVYTDQISFTASYENNLIDELKKIDANTLSPIEALTTLYELVNKAKEI